MRALTNRETDTHTKLTEFIPSTTDAGGNYRVQLRVFSVFNPSNKKRDIYSRVKDALHGYQNLSIYV